MAHLGQLELMLYLGIDGDHMKLDRVHPVQRLSKSVDDSYSF